MNPSRVPPRLLTLGLSLGLASSTLCAALPASAVTAPTQSASGATSVAGYAGSPGEAASNKAFFAAVLTSVADQRAAQPGGQAVTLHYDASEAPSFRSQIASAAAIWNSSESNVKLAEASSGADFSYSEGNDPSGSHASTDGHGGGRIFLDYTQIQQNDPIRVVAHETGHVLGLQDDYSGPCSELMSGGGPGPSCTNRYPDATERARVDQLWANGRPQASGTGDQPADGSSAAPSAQTVIPGTGNQPADGPSAAPPAQPVGPGQGPWRPLLRTPWH